MKKILFGFLALTYILSITSCKKDKDPEVEPEYDAAYDGLEVYLSGYIQPENASMRATIWKNGKPSFPADPNHPSWAYDVRVQGSDVYAVGYVWRENESNNQQTGRVPILWKNGKRQDIEKSGDVEPRKLYISPRDNIYMIGYDFDNGNQQTIWKNNQRINMENRGSDMGFREMIEINGSLYVAGSTRIGAYLYATTWKDGKVQQISSLISTGDFIGYYGSDIYTYISNVHESDSKDRAFRVLKNNSLQYKLPLSKEDINNIDHTIGYMEGENTYVAAQFSYYPQKEPKTIKIWKNGKVLRELKGGDYTLNSFVVKNDADYIVCLDYKDNNYTPKLFRAGKELPIDFDAGKTNRIEGIYVK